MTNLSSRLAVAFTVSTIFLHAEQPLTIKPHAAPGPCSVKQWKVDWPGCEWEDGVKEGNLAIAERDGQNIFRVNYQPGQIGPEKGGVGWRYPIGMSKEAQLTYTVRFSPNFDWVKGGKLPGLCGGPSNTSGGRPADGTNGFSARLMWRADGRAEAYVYHKNQKTNYGDSFAFPADFRFPTDTKVTVRLRVAMNDPGQTNGKLDVWVTLPDQPEHLMVSRSDMEWRTVPTFGVDAIYFESFHGGGDPSWAPRRPCWAEFGAVRATPQ